MVSIYATGQGQTSPAGVTGSVAGAAGATPLLPVTVTIGGVVATVQYAGSAPGEVSGLLQVNAVVPAGVGPGAAVPVTLSIGGVTSQAGVTMAVKIGPALNGFNLNALTDADLTFLAEASMFLPPPL